MFTPPKKKIFAMKAATKKTAQTTYRNLSNDSEVIHVAEFFKNRFYLVTFKKNTNKHDTPIAHYFCTDDLLTYQGFYADFGPLNLGMVYRYCLMIASKLNSKELRSKAVVHYTSMDPRKRANAAYLAATFAVIYLNMPPRTAWEILRTQKSFMNILPSKLGFLSFRDAQPYTNRETIVNTISIYDCIKAMDSAFFYNFINFSDFALGHYEAFQVNGYSLLNWIVPSKLLALCNPSNEPLSPIYINRIIRYFTINNVGIIVRLNEATYNSLRFSNVGIHHVDMYFDDGTPPPLRILTEFLYLVENSTQAVAVHCRAGLGRTGSLIAAYLMKHYRMTSKEAIAWLRICRPGCVIGNQQAWLDTMQPQLWDSGDLYRLKNTGFQLRFTKHKYGIYSKDQSSWIRTSVSSKESRSSPQKCVSS